MNKMIRIIPLLFLLIGLTACAEAVESVAVSADSARSSADQEDLDEDEMEAEPSTEYKEVANGPLSPARLAEFTEFVENTRQEYEVPGMAVAVVQGDQILLAEGFGVRNIDEGGPVTPETLFHIGSTNKSVTAMLIATLVDEGLLAWDEPVSEIIPEFELSEPTATETVTIRHLLSMSSGIPDEAEEEFDIESQPAAEIFDLLAETPLLAEPGEAFSYSNLSSAASGYIGVLAAGGDFAELTEGYARLLQTRIFEPIGMPSATLSVDTAQASGHYSASHVRDEAGAVVVAESYDFSGDPLAPSGAIKANVVDMARYMSTQVRHGLAPNGQRVVSAENLGETWQPVIDAGEGSSYALGWLVGTAESEAVIWHDGSYDSFTSMLAFVPEAEVGLVVLTNFDEPDDLLEVIRDEFVAQVLAD